MSLCPNTFGPESIRCYVTNHGLATTMVMGFWYDEVQDPFCLSWNRSTFLFNHNPTVGETFAIVLYHRKEEYSVIINQNVLIWDKMPEVFGVLTKIPKRFFFLNRQQKNWSSFVVNYHPSILNCRWVSLATDALLRSEWKATLKKLGYNFF